MAYDVGDVAVFRLDIENYDGTTVAAVEVKAPDGTVTNPAPVSSNNGATWTVQVPLGQAGIWYIGWHVTGTGASTAWDQAEAEVPPPATEAQDDVRLLIADTDPSIRMFSTRQIAAFLRLNSDNVRRAAAQALDTIAANEALVSKKIRTQDLSTDGPAVADALRKQAAELRRQADAGDGDSESFGFEVAEFTPYPCRPDWPY
ncbi:MAG TPA: hypothetical protein VIQ79_13030 [Kribbella sp.]